MRHRVNSLFYRVEMSNSAAHSSKDSKGKFNGDVRGKYFLHRAVAFRNVLPWWVMQVPDMILTFKIHLNRNMSMHRMEG